MNKRISLLTTLIILTACGSPTTPGVTNNVAGSPLFDSKPSAQQAAERRNSAPVKLKFKAAVVKGSGDVTAVARQDFIASPYSIEKVRAELILKNKPGDKPTKTPDPEMPSLTAFLSAEGRPNLSDARYKKQQCLSSGSYCYDTTDSQAWLADVKAWDNAQDKAYEDAKAKYNSDVAANAKKFQEDTTAWEAKAYVGLDEAKKQAAGGLESVTFKTNLSGEAEITLTEGTWYFTGKYSLLQGDSNVYWTEVPITITKSSTEVELSNDNGNVINLR